MTIESNDDKEMSSTDIFASPQPLDFDCLCGDMVVLLGGGIVNPFGPTLQLTAALGKWDAGTDMPVVRAMLNPFQQEVNGIGTLRLRDRLDPVETLLSFMPANPGGCPTALLVSPLLYKRPRDVIAVVGTYLALCDSSALTLDGVKLFPGDPRARVRHAIDGATKTMASQRSDESTAVPEPRKLTAEEGVELAKLQLTRDHWVEEWRGFVACWRESIASPQLAALAMTYDKVEPIVTRVIDCSYATLAETLNADDFLKNR